MKTYKHNESLVTKYARENLIGKTFNSNNFGEFKVVGIYDTYTNNHRTLIRYICKFLKTGYETLALANAIKNGSVKDKYIKFLCGIGYAGEFEGNYSKHFLYVHWQGMIERCYNEKIVLYRELGEVDEAWHSFSNFIEDCKDLLGYIEMIENPSVKFSIDKDFVKEGNQVYSKKYCCFIPQALNTFILNTNKNREYDFEGLHMRGDSLKFRSSIRYEGKTKSIMQSEDPLIAHEAYWKEKFNIANIYLENDFSFLSDELKQLVYNRVKLKHEISKNELKRAMKDGYFDSLIKEKRGKLV